MDGNNPFLNGGFALGGGFGSTPVSAPFSMGGVGPGAMLQSGNVPNVFGAALPSSMRDDMLNLIPGMNNDVMQQAKMMPNQYSGSNQEIADKVAAADQAKSNMDAYKIMAQGIQGMGRGMQMQMPSGNTAQIIRDNNQFRFVGTPQQQMAQALRRRG